MRTAMLAILVCFSAVCHAEDAHKDNPLGWRSLFNGKDLDGWYVFLQEHGKDKDPDHVVTIDDGMIHAYKEPAQGSKVVMGYIATNEEFENYHLRFEFKWGEKQFQPRLELKPDAGLYYHLCGPDAVWPKSLQYQIQRGDVGDLLALYGVQVDTWMDPATANVAEHSYLDPADGGQAITIGGSGIAYHHRQGMYELDGWNTVELICDGRTSTHILNGKIVNRCENIRQLDPEHPGPAQALTRGRIALEFEATEIFYRNIEIRSLKQDDDKKRAKRERHLSVGAAAVNLPAKDTMVIAGGIGPWNPNGQEGELRATALVLQKGTEPPVALVGCDVLFVTRDMIDAALAEIETATGIPPSNVLVNASHTHSAPSVTRVHGYDIEPEFKKTLQNGIVEAVKQAHARLEKGCEFDFAQGAEYSVGENSRLLLSDNTIFWTGSKDDAVRPTAPFDPELPVLAFRGGDGGLRALFFNHSTHTIGTTRGMVRSPSYYGLAAQELERDTGATIGFLEGASGSTHNLNLTARPMVDRIKFAVLDTLAKTSRMPVSELKAVRAPFTFKVRTFDEAVEEKKVVDYCHKRIPQAGDSVAVVFRTMRKELAPHQGEERTTWLQAIRIGDVVIVGVPAEYFTVLGMEIKKRSPFEYTYVAELSNDWVGYLPDLKGHELGGYQTWMGYHSFAEPGTGERIVDETVKLIESLR